MPVVDHPNPPTSGVSKAVGDNDAPEIISSEPYKSLVPDSDCIRQAAEENILPLPGLSAARDYTHTDLEQSY